VQLLLLAFRDALHDIDDPYFRSSIEAYAWNAGAYRDTTAHYKLWPTNAGREDIIGLVDARSFDGVCEKYSLRYEGKGRKKLVSTRSLIVEAYMYLYGMIALFLRGIDPDEPPHKLDVLDEILLQIDVEGEGEPTVDHQWRRRSGSKRSRSYLTAIGRQI
jgi:hypothetical protein